LSNNPPPRAIKPLPSHHKQQTMQPLLLHRLWLMPYAFVSLSSQPSTEITHMSHRDDHRKLSTFTSVAICHE
jgi:hypothetical protein